jgi:hypothetical protein
VRTLIDDTVLDTFAAVGDPKTVAALIIERYCCWVANAAAAAVDDDVARESDAARWQTVRC